MANNVKGNAIRLKRRKSIDSKVTEAQTGRKMPKKKKRKKNPYPAGSARAKAWARKNQ